METKKMHVAHDLQHAKWVGILRILLGIVIFLKGIHFISNTAELQAMLDNSRLQFASFILTHFVAAAHLVGGILIAFGILTRVAILFQIPILLGAVVFINSRQGIFSMESELMLSVVVLALLIFFAVYGPGAYAYDRKLKRDENKR